MIKSKGYSKKVITLAFITLVIHSVYELWQRTAGTFGFV